MRFGGAAAAIVVMLVVLLAASVVALVLVLSPPQLLTSVPTPAPTPASPAAAAAAAAAAAPDAQQQPGGAQQVFSGGGGGGDGKRVFAPFTDTSMPMGNPPLTAVTLGFVLANAAKRPSWNGTDPLSASYPQSLLKKFGQQNCIVSAGGQAGTELAAVLESPAELAAAYAEVLKATGVGWLDLDIEGSILADAAMVDRRNAALAILQKSNPGLKLSYTLQVMPTGLPQGGVDLLANANKHGVKLFSVCVMAMDYGGSFAGDQGAHAINAAKNTRAQVLQAYGECGIGICPMLGVNDQRALVFTPAHARAVVAFAKQTPWVNWLTYWSIERDHKGPAGELSNTHSGLDQAEWEFAKIFSG